MTLGTENRKTAEFTAFFGQLNIGTASGHVGRNRYRFRTAGFRDDLSLACMVLGVQNFMRDAFFFEHVVEKFGNFNGDCTD